MRTSRIPRELATFRGLRTNIMNFNPFKPVILFPGGCSDPKLNEHGIGVYLQGKGLRREILQNGLQATWEALNKESGGNAGRTFRRLKSFVPPDPNGFELPDLFALYR